MAPSVTDHVVPQFSDTLLRAVAQHAERQAHLTGTYLRNSGFCPDGEIRLPGPALLELAAVLELGVWERRGIRQYLPADLLTYREAADQLAARCMKGPAEFQGRNAAPLSLRIFRVWVEHFAWDGPDLLDADVVLSDADHEDDFIDLLAEFIWTHRNELQHLIHAGGNDEKA